MPNAESIRHGVAHWQRVSCSDPVFVGLEILSRFTDRPFWEASDEHVSSPPVEELVKGGLTNVAAEELGKLGWEWSAGHLVYWS